MPANTTYRQGAGRQRHHKHRVGRMLVPHGHVSGLLFTVNPRQEPKALRELQLYLQPLIADLEEAQRKAEEQQDSKEEDSALPQESAFAGEEKMAPSTSSLLAAELAEYVSTNVGQRHDGRKRSRMEDTDNNKSNTNNNNNSDGDNDGDSQDSNAGQSAGQKRGRNDVETSQRKVMNCRRWLAPLETGCKGHLMVSIPFPPQEHKEEEEEKEEEAGSEIATAEEAQIETAEEKTTQNQSDTPPHSILTNPLVHTVVERIFKDIEENPRPLLRNCFRLMPCELTCCPTLPEMRIGLERLVEAHFPIKEGETPRLHRVSLSFKVRNNTGVDNKKAYFHAALETVFPVNRFVVIPAARMKSCDVGVEAVFCVLVAHGTCVMGVQRHFTERGEYNLHALGVKHLELSSSV